MSSHFSFYCCAEEAMDSLFRVTSSSCPARSIPHPSPPLPASVWNVTCLYLSLQQVPHIPSWAAENTCYSLPLFLRCPHALLCLSAGSFQWDAAQLSLCTSSGSTEPPHPLLFLPWYLSVTFHHTESFYSFTALRDCYLSHCIGKPSSSGSAVSFIPCSAPGDVYHLTHNWNTHSCEEAAYSSQILFVFSSPDCQETKNSLYLRLLKTARKKKIDSTTYMDETNMLFL